MDDEEVDSKWPVAVDHEVAQDTSFTVSTPDALLMITAMSMGTSVLVFDHPLSNPMVSTLVRPREQ